MQNILIIADGRITDTVILQLIVKSLRTSNSICKISVVTSQDLPISTILLEADDALSIDKLSFSLLKQLRDQRFDLCIAFRNSLSSVLLRNLVKQKSTFVFSKSYYAFRKLNDTNSSIKPQLRTLDDFLKAHFPNFSLEDRIRIPTTNLELLNEMNFLDWNRNRPQFNATILIKGQISRQYELMLITVLNKLSETTSFNYGVIIQGMKDSTFNRIKKTVSNSKMLVVNFSSKGDDLQILSLIVKSHFLVTNNEEWRYFTMLLEKEIPCYYLSITAFDKQKISGKRPTQRHINESKVKEIEYFIKSRNSIKPKES